LARNPAAPVDVLLRLLETAPDDIAGTLGRRPDLPPPVRDAMLRHLSPRIRGALAAHPRVDPQAREVLLADPQWRVRIRAWGNRDQRPLSDEALTRLLAELDDPPPPDVPFTREELLGELFTSAAAGPRLRTLAAKHSRPGVRRYAAGFLTALDEPTRQALLTDETSEVRQVAADAVAYREQLMEPADLPDHRGHAYWTVLHRRLSRDLVDHVLAGGDVAAVGVLAANASTPPDVVEALLRHPEPAVRRKVAERPDLTAGQLAALAADPAVEVRTTVSVHPGLTERQRARIAIDVTTADGDGCFGPAGGCHAYPYFRVLPAEVADSVRWARSVNPLLRRRAAGDPRLPGDMVATLADDPDPGVRVLLAQHHPASPPDLLLRCLLEYQGCGRERLAERPGFPTEGLGRFVDDLDPVLRRLVARDPAVDPAVVDRLTADPDPRVRKAMAGSPRLPVARIVALLTDSELAESAAANPALPVERMWRIAEEWRR
ncbi:hypothetical protein ACFOX0_33270, partial [Micromonospora zhanjiangensis]